MSDIPAILPIGRQIQLKFMFLY